jgi:hypothetical protein
VPLKRLALARRSWLGPKEYQEPLMRASASAFYAGLKTTTKGLLFFQDRTVPSECNPDIHLR